MYFRKSNIRSHQLDWVCSKTQTLLEILKTLNQLRGDLMYLRKSNLCSDVQKQKSVSHNSTESEIISLDAGLRMDGIPCS